MVTKGGRGELGAGDALFALSATLVLKIGFPVEQIFRMGKPALDGFHFVDPSHASKPDSP